MTEDYSNEGNEGTQEIIDNIQKYGCHLVAIEADNYLPGFVYSIGLFENFRHPEIICFGLRTEVMGAILNHACDLVKSGQTLVPGELYSGFLEGYRVQFATVHSQHYKDYLGYAGWYYEHFDFPALQLVWPDKENRFPWEEGFNPDWKFKQPLLDRNTDFKFYEERNLGVFTTKQTFEGQPILFVYHDEDGDWQFHPSAEPDLNDSKVVCLDDIVKLDPSINEVFHLQYGWRAWRESQDGEWVYEEYERGA